MLHCIETRKWDKILYNLFLHLWSLEELRVEAQAQARAAAQAEVEQQVKTTLDAEKAAYSDSLMDSIMKERMKTEDEKLMVQLYVRTRWNPWAAYVC